MRRLRAQGCAGFGRKRRKLKTLKDIENCQKAFELFVDVGEEPKSEITKGVKKIKISQAFKHIGEKLDFFFDDGDGWQFTVELKEIRSAEKGEVTPVILESIGKAPLQYPPCEDEGEQGEAE